MMFVTKQKFKHELGVEAIAKVTRMKGVITARSENLYGCNRYYLQPQVDSENKVPEGWWTDEDDLEVIEKKVEHTPKPTGGPMSKTC